MRRLGLTAGRRVLLLQGPNGPFFARLAAALEADGVQVTKVNFNGGDCVFFPRASHTFREPLEAWPTLCERLMTEQRFDSVLLFGDCRPIHRVAIEVAHRLGVPVGVFEEGYLRPNFVTFELGGVNGHSSLARDPAFYRRLPPGGIPDVSPVQMAFWWSVIWSIVYHCAGSALRPWFPHYEHHRRMSVREARPWARGAWRKLRYRLSEAGVQDELTSSRAGKFFLVPLQVHNDAQVTVHSSYASVAEFIAEVIGSFASHAPADTQLVLKHHPLDRGYHDYTDLIGAEARKRGVAERVRYIHDQHLPSLLEAARGVVVINSTAGLQALDHLAPVKVCGRAVYDLEGLTFSGPLDAFWRAAQDFAVDQELFASFKRYLAHHTQLGGSFYCRLPSGGLLEDLGPTDTRAPAALPSDPAEVSAAAE